MRMTALNESEGRNLVPAIIVILLVVALLIGMPYALHRSQKSHNVLPFKIADQFPPEKPFASGEIFASTVIALMDRELSGGTGWRPNDFPLWRHTVLGPDNNANRQIGIIQAVRESLRVFRDNLTKVSSSEYDTNLRNAETLFRNDEKRFWFPSAERRFREGNEALRLYVKGLHTEPPTSKPINQRNVELMQLFQAWTDLLGGAHANLYKQREAGTDDKPGPRVSMWHTDDYFYQAQGYAHVMYHLNQAVQREYAGQMENRPALKQLLAEVTDALGQAATMKPLVVLDGRPTSPFANHRRNLDVFIVDARQKMYSIREELEK
jgi:hypothetical protein